MPGIGTALDAANLAAQILQANSSPLSAGEKIPVSSFYSVSGLYSVNDPSGNALYYRQPGSITVNLNPYDATYAFQSDLAYVNIYIVPDGNPLILSLSNGINQQGFNIEQGGYFAALPVALGSSSGPANLGTRVYGGSSGFAADWRYNSESGELYLHPSAPGKVLDGLGSDHHLTTNDPNAPIANGFGSDNVVILPNLEPGTLLDYDELKALLVADLSSAYNIDVDAILELTPSYEEMYPDTTEPTEPGDITVNIDIDYDEILSEDELESILTQETYNIEEIETDTGVYLLDLPDDTAPPLPSEVVGVVGLISNQSAGAMDALGIAGICTAFITIGILMYILRGSR